MSRSKLLLATLLLAVPLLAQEVIPLEPGGEAHLSAAIAVTEDFIVVGRHFFDRHTGQEVLRIDGPSGVVAADGKLVAWWGSDEVRVLDLETWAWSSFQPPPGTHAAAQRFDLAGTRLAFGDFGDDELGQVYVVDLATGGPPVVFQAQESIIGELFGYSVALDGDLLVVGAPRVDSVAKHAGAAYVFDLVTGQQVAKLVPEGAVNFAYHGVSVAACDGIVVVGAETDHGAIPLSGAAYVYDARGGQLLHRIFPADGEDHRRLGTSVDIDGPWVLLGGGNGDGNGPGTVHLFSAMTGREVQVAGRRDVIQGLGFGLQMVLAGDSIVTVGPDPLSTGPAAYLIRPRWESGPTPGRAYRTLHDTRWPRAKKRARALGGDLVTVRSQTENDWLRSTYAALEPAWIGFTDKAVEGSFEWISGEVPGYSNWGPGQPDDAGGQDFAALQRDGTWRDEAEVPVLLGVVEVDGTDCDGDGRPDAYDIAVDPGRDWNGDGLLDDCVPATYCGPAVPNSTGSAGRIDAAGSPDVGLNLFRLRGERLPPDEAALFLMSTGSGFVPLFGGGAGSLCLASPFVTLPPVSTGAGSVQVDLSLTGLVAPGDTRYFQLWFRDGATSNLTDALEVRFR